MFTMLFVGGCYDTKAYAAEFTDAIPIQVNQAVTGNLTEGYYDEQDYYMFTISDPGSVTVNFKNPMQNSADAYWKVVLYNWEYKELLTEEIYGNKTSSDLTSMGLPTGSYYLKVESVYGGEAKSTDNYSICVQYSMSNAWEKEFNDEFTTATVVNPNMSYSGTTRGGYDYEKDYYAIELRETGCLTVNFSNLLQSDDSACWRVYLYDDEYNEIYSKDISGNMASTNLPATGLDAGKYYILVQSTISYMARSNDVYTLALDFTPSMMWEKERNEDFITATPLEVEKVCYGTTSGGGDYEKDYYSLDILVAGNYNIQFDTPNQKSNDSFWYVELYDSTYQKIEDMYVYGNKTTHQMSRRLDVDTYYIRVTSTVSYQAKSTDTYELMVTKKTSAPAKPKKVTLKPIKAGKNMATISWKKLLGVSGYDIYMSRSKSNGYKKIRTVSGTLCKKTGLTRGKRYYFKVRAYKYVDGRKVNGAFSNVRSVLIK